VGKLVQQGLASEDDLRRVRWLEVFGCCLGNTDMHFGNLAFLLDGTQPQGLAPVYDMLPMHYFPRHQELSSTPFPLPPAKALQVPDALKAAADLWQAVAADRRVSRDFRQIAREAQKRIMGLGGGPK
jgi:hypothetical protein